MECYVLIKDHEFALSVKIMLHEQFDFYRIWQMVRENTRREKIKIFFSV